MATIKVKPDFLKDSQVSRFYNAVASMPEWDGYDHRAREGMEGFIKGVQMRKFVQRHFKNSRNAGYIGYTGRRARYNGYAWKIWTKMRILHAMLHSVVDDTTTRRLHGPEFCRDYLKLVQNVLGKDVALRLKAAYKLHRVKYRTPRKDVTSRKGNPMALRAYRMSQEMIRADVPIWDLFAPSGKG